MEVILFKILRVTLHLGNAKVSYGGDRLIGGRLERFYCIIFSYNEYLFHWQTGCNPCSRGKYCTANANGDVTERDCSAGYICVSGKTIAFIYPFLGYFPIQSDPVNLHH